MGYLLKFMEDNLHTSNSSTFFLSLADLFQGQDVNDLPTALYISYIPYAWMF